jgi:hypothetical protein
MASMACNRACNPEGKIGLENCILKMTPYLQAPVYVEHMDKQEDPEI